MGPRSHKNQPYAGALRLRPACNGNERYTKYVVNGVTCETCNKSESYDTLDVLISIQAIDKTGKILTIPSSNFNFEYRKSNLPKDLIFLSASFKGKPKSKDLIKQEIEMLKLLQH